MEKISHYKRMEHKKYVSSTQVMSEQLIDFVCIEENVTNRITNHIEIELK